MESTAGLTALALFVLWLGYYVPHRVRHRQQLLESRTEDRFSGSLRVLAVATGLAVRDPVDDRQQNSAATAGGTVLPRLGNRPTLLLATAGVGGDGPQARSTDLVHQEDPEEGTYAMESTTRAGDPRSRPAARPQAAHPGAHEGSHGHPSDEDDGAGPRPAIPPSRLALLERRAAAARRRLTLTVLLLLASAGLGAAYAFSYVPWYAAVAPAALLVLVLVLGRRAVVSQQRSDAQWLAERRAAVRASREPVAGSPATPRNRRPRVTGHAVHSSQASTQMIPRVTERDVARGREAGARRERSERREQSPADEPDESERAGADGAASAGGPRTTGGARVGEADVVVSPEPSGNGAVLDGPSGERSDEAPGARAGGRPPGPSGEHTDPEATGAPESPGEASGRAWDPVPVPRPTYTMKAAAPRREPAPLPEPAQEEPAALSAPVPVVQDGAPDAADGPARAPGDEPRPKTETLGLDLNEILARRRAAGQ